MLVYWVLINVVSLGKLFQLQKLRILQLLLLRNTVIGQTAQAFGKFNSTKLRPQIAKALKTEKIEIPEEVQLHFEVDFTNIQVKLKKIFDLSIFQNDGRELKDGDIEYSTAIINYVKIYAVDKNRMMKQVSVQFTFVNNPYIIFQSQVGQCSNASHLNLDNSFKVAQKVAQSMIEIVGKKLKKQKRREEVKAIDRFTMKLKVYPNMGGIPCEDVCGKDGKTQKEAKGNLAYHFLAKARSIRWDRFCLY